MKLAVIRTALARRDLRDILVYIGRASPQSARRFRDAFERSIDLLASRPGIGMLYEPDNQDYAGIRLCPVTRFRSYLIVYRVADDRLEVLRVLHGARDVDRILADDLAPDEP